MNKNVIEENMMGPNPITILEELLEKVEIKKGSKILDLGCGKGLTSMYLAQKYDVTVYAVDLWISKEENQERFEFFELQDKIIAINADANNLQFENNFFDAIISIDAYHYFGNNNSYFKDKILPLLKKDAQVIIGIPGMKYEVKDNVPEEMKPYWDSEILETVRPIEYWKPKFQEYLKYFEIFELKCFNKAWRSWLDLENQYSSKDIPMLMIDNARFMNLIGICGIVK